ncbi:MAG: TlpA family protein disulfide reductase [Proteobacteria bacterium]|nr:TlpA family protein disulfide reductase [Desulfobacula sp.]MBU4130910.1 TlpA family protein disulfide reductase [Pseudomonadota bacterium]
MKKILRFALIICLLLTILACGQGPAVVNVGDPAPDFSLKDLEGKTWVLSELKGQVVFINFWATWCPPCMKELPSMQKLYETLPGDKFKMLAVLNNDKPAVANFIANQNGFAMPILDDSQQLTGSKYAITGLPETFIVDKQGIVREKVIGPAQWDSPDSVQMISNLINQ